MLSLGDIRGYIAGLGITDDERVYIGKLDNKKEKSIGVYNRKGDGPPPLPLGGLDYSSYDTKRVSLLVHWNKDVLESEKSARALYDALLKETSLTIGEEEIRFLVLQVPEPVDVGTDDNGIYEYVIWLDFIFQRK